MKNTLRKRALLLGSALLIVVAMLIGVAFPGMAATDGGSGTTSAQPANPNILRGKVTAVAADKTSFTIQAGTQAPVTVKVDSNTKYYKVQPPIKLAAANVKPGPTAPLVPPSLKNKIQDKGMKEKVEAKLKEKFQEKNLERGLGQKKALESNEDTSPEITDEMINELEIGGQTQGQQAQGGAPGLARKLWLKNSSQKATFEDIAVGDRIITKVMPNENLAKLVLIIKQPKVKAVRGTVTSLTANTIGITPANGTEVVLNWDANTRFVLTGITSVQAGQGLVASASYDTDTKLAKTVSVQKPVPVPAPAATPPTT